jgi:hypothetical protein
MVTITPEIQEAINNYVAAYHEFKAAEEAADANLGTAQRDAIRSENFRPGSLKQYPEEVQDLVAECEQAGLGLGMAELNLNVALGTHPLAAEEEEGSRPEEAKMKNDMTKHDCPRCDGTGTYEITVEGAGTTASRCRPCAGTGKVTRKEWNECSDWLNGGQAKAELAAKRRAPPSSAEQQARRDRLSRLGRAANPRGDRDESE